MNRAVANICVDTLRRGLAVAGTILLSACLNEHHPFPYVSVGGTVSGLNGAGLVLQNNVGDDLVISGNGGFTFNTPILRGTGYHVSVLIQPNNPPQRCSVTQGSGFAFGRVDHVQVNCVDTHTVGGTVLGLRGSDFILRNNGGDDLAISADGDFTFNAAVASGESYSITVLSQPGAPAQTCAVTNASGVITNDDITNVEVSCNTNTYLFYKNPLSAVDPTDLAVPTEIEPVGSIANVTAVEHATYRPAPFYVLIDRHYETIIYRKSASGTFWKVSALSGGSLTPVQVSNATGVTTICLVWAEPDYADPDNAQIVYRLPGADNTCGNSDDVWKMIKVGMSVSDAPYPAIQPLAAVHDTATGAIAGWLAINGSNLNAYDVNFSNPTLVSTFTSTPTVLATAPAGHIVLFIDSQLRVYHPQATPPTLSASLGTVAGIGNARRDTAYVYFDDSSALYRLPLDGSAAAGIVHTGSGWVSLLALSESYLVYWDDSSLKSIPKSGGSAVTFATTGGESIEPVGASGNKIYFHSFYFCGGWCSTAHVIEEDGTNDISIADAAWFGWTEPTTVSFGSGSRDLPLERVLLRNVLTAPYTVTSYAAANGTALATLGTLPVTMDQGYSPFFMRLTNRGNLLGYSFDNSNGSNDVIFANTETSDSLVRVTDSAENESVVGASGCSIQRHADVDPTLYLALLAAFPWLLRHRRRRDT